MNSFPVALTHNSHNREKGVIKWAFGIAWRGEKICATSLEAIQRNSAVSAPIAMVAGIREQFKTCNSSN